MIATIDFHIPNFLGEMKLDPYITHTFEGLEGVNEAIKALHGGDCLRAVVHVAKNDIPSARVSLNYIYLDL